MGEKIKAIVADEVDGKVKGQLTEIDTDDLPDDNVLVDVDYSTLNYKDGLAVCGVGRIARFKPMVCGADLAGTVAESASPEFKTGDKVVVTGWGMSESHWGGYAQKQRVKSEWLVKVPESLNTRSVMAVGTAGLTAMLCVMALEDHGVKPDSGDIIVTGAAGGVGSVAVAVLAKLGYSVTAVTGRDETHDYLRGLGAANILPRAELAEQSKPFQKELWAGCVDTVGSQLLANTIAQMKYGGTVAACGLAGGSDLPTTVLPFILRGVTLAGVDSVYCPLPRRQQAWDRIARDLPMEKLEAMTSVEPMSKVPELAAAILKGQTRGRVVIDVNT